MVAWSSRVGGKNQSYMEECYCFLVIVQDDQLYASTDCGLHFDRIALPEFDGSEVKNGCDIVECPILFCFNAILQSLILDVAVHPFRNELEVLLAVSGNYSLVKNVFLC